MALLLLYMGACLIGGFFLSFTLFPGGYDAARGALPGVQALTIVLGFIFTGILLVVGFAVILTLQEWGSRLKERGRQ